MIEETLAEDVRLMLEHALATGRRVQPSWLDAARVDPSSADAVHRLSRAHDGLAALIAPATPRTLRYLADSGGSRRRLPIVRWLSLLSVVFLLGFITLELDPDVGSRASDWRTGSGHELFVNVLFQLSAAGLGATFAALFAISGKLRDYSLDPRDEFAAWVRIMLGLIAGLVLGQLVPFDDAQGRELGRPMLALLGGFSVDVVSQTLRRLVELASSIIAPTADTTDSLRVAAEARDSQMRVGVAQRLVRLRASLDGPAAAEVDALISELAPSDVSPDPEVVAEESIAPTPARRPARA